MSIYRKKTVDQPKTMPLYSGQ